MYHGVHYFEIPVTDMDRAIAFYETVFECLFDRQEIDGYDMALFPEIEGASGALAQGDVYVPAKTGPVVYFTVESIETVLARVSGAGGQVLYPKKDIGDLGFVAEFEDSEGNRIALSERK